MAGLTAPVVEKKEPFSDLKFHSLFIRKNERKNLFAPFCFSFVSFRLRPGARALVQLADFSTNAKESEG